MSGANEIRRQRVSVQNIPYGMNQLASSRPINNNYLSEITTNSLHTRDTLRHQTVHLKSVTIFSIVSSPFPTVYIGNISTDHGSLATLLSDYHPLKPVAVCVNKSSLLSPADFKAGR